MKLFQKGYRVIDTNPDNWPREIQIQQWKEDTQPLAGRNQEQSLEYRELKDIYRQYVGQELTKRMIRDCNKALNSGDFSNPYPEQTLTVEDRKERLKEYTQYLQTGKAPDGSLYTFEPPIWSELNTQIQNFSIIEFRNRVRNEDTKAYEDKEGSNQLYAFVSAASLQKKLTGTNPTTERKELNKIVNNGTLVNVMKCETKSALVKNTKGEETSRLYRIYESEQYDNEYDTIQAKTIKIQLDYHPAHPSRNVPWIDTGTETNTFFSSDQQGGLARSLGKAKSFLPDILSGNPLIAKGDRKRFVPLYRPSTNNTDTPDTNDD